MRIFKKLIALTAIAACVLTMSSPVIAKAEDVEVCAVSGCKDGNHIMGKQVYQGTSISTSTHATEMGYICTVTSTYANYLITCECGAVSGGTTSSLVSQVHSVCGN